VLGPCSRRWPGASSGRVPDGDRWACPRPRRRSRSFW
jgi:hypothetical protein